MKRDHLIQQVPAEANANACDNTCNVRPTPNYNDPQPTQTRQGEKRSQQNQPNHTIREEKNQNNQTKPTKKKKKKKECKPNQTKPT
jgi:hypothetical protein